MKQFRMVIWAIIFIFMGLIIFQNQEFFLSKQILRVNFGIVDVYESTQVPVAIIFLVFFLFGVLIAYLFSLPERFKTNKMLKKLKAINTSLENELAGLKREVATLKGEPIETKDDPQEQTAETPENHVAAKRAETATDTTDEGNAESQSGDTTAAKSESLDEAADENRFEADDDSKKGGMADNSTDRSIAKNT